MWTSTKPTTTCSPILSADSDSLTSPNSDFAGRTAKNFCAVWGIEPKSLSRANERNFSVSQYSALNSHLSAVASAKEEPRTPFGITDHLSLACRAVLSHRSLGGDGSLCEGGPLATFYCARAKSSTATEISLLSIGTTTNASKSTATWRDLDQIRWRIASNRTCSICSRSRANLWFCLFRATA